MAIFEGKKVEASEVAQKAASDTTKYDIHEVAHHLCDGMMEELYKCAHAHCPIFDEPEFFVVFLNTKDNVIPNLIRRKFTALLHLPKPRPNQTVYLYNKAMDRFKQLWALPHPLRMAELSCNLVVKKEEKRMKNWCDAFFDGTFHELIRKENNFNHLSEKEYLEAHREELIKAGCNDGTPPPSDSFDLEKVITDKIVDANNSIIK